MGSAANMQVTYIIKGLVIKPLNHSLACMLMLYESSKLGTKGKAKNIAFECHV